MTLTTIKQAIVAALEDLGKYNLSKFLFYLLDRREEPRISHSAVEDKSILVIADRLVSTFTERKALQVTLDLLRQINCNEEAERLDSKTKVCLDKGDPIFPKTSTGELETEPSQEALEYAAVQRPLQAAQYRGPKEVEADAKALVLSEGGDPHNDRLVLSRFIIQFGKYKGKSFKWLLENVRWVVYLVWSHLRARKEGIKQEGPLMANKDSLTQYATAFPEVSKKANQSVGMSDPSGESKMEMRLLASVRMNWRHCRICTIQRTPTKSATSATFEPCRQLANQGPKWRSPSDMFCIVTKCRPQLPPTGQPLPEQPQRPTKRKWAQSNGHQPITASWPKRGKSKRNQRRANPKSRY